VNEPWVEAREICYATPGPDGRRTEILRSVDAAFEKGRPALVSGPMGAGKSTLLHILACILRPTGGEVVVGGRPVSRWSAAHRDRWRREVGIVFQAAHLWQDLTPLENVILPLIPRGLSLAAIRSQGLEAMETFGVLSLAGRKVRDLSGGERQGLALARAWAARPPLVLADEPTAHQDDAGVERFLRWVDRAARQGTAVIAASHDPRIRDPGAFPDRWRLADGRLEREP